MVGFSLSGNKMQFKTTLPASNSGFDPKFDHNTELSATCLEKMISVQSPGFSLRNRPPRVG